MNTHKLVTQELITLRQALVISLVETGWPIEDARKVVGELVARPQTQQKNVGETKATASRRVSRRRKNTWNRWTEQERETLTRLWKEGVAIKDISSQLNRPSTQITSALTRYGLYKEYSRRQQIAV